MPSFYNSEFKCTNCNYIETLRTAPIVIEPINNSIPQAKIEYRWCKNCNGIRFVFTAALDNEKLRQRIDKLNAQIRESENKKSEFKQKLESLIEERKNIKLNFVQRLFADHFFYEKIDSVIETTRRKIIEIEEKIKNDKKPLETSLITSRYAQEFYESKNSIPRCLCCGSVDVSSVSFENENHTCGGKIVKTSYRGGSTVGMTKIKYDAFGNSEAGSYTFDLFEEEKLIQKLEKPYPTL